MLESQDFSLKLKKKKKLKDIAFLPSFKFFPIEIRVQKSAQNKYPAQCFIMKQNLM